MGSFTNNAAITLVGGGIGVRRGSFYNNAGGNISIKGGSLGAGGDLRGGTFYNDAKIIIVGGGIGTGNGADFTNSKSGNIEIDSTTNNGIYTINLEPSIFKNEGNITIGAKYGIGGYGISNMGGGGSFNNSGVIKINNNSSGGIKSNRAFSNSGSITIGSTGPAGQYGINNSGSFDNGGEIKIDNSTEYAIFHQGSMVTFGNSGNIIIGSIASSGQVGIYNGSRFSNSGNIKIDNVTVGGLQNVSSFQGDFTNTGKITLGSIASVGQYGIKNSGSFNNSGCGALINIMSNSIIENSSTFTNSGTIIENASGNSSISTNTGIVQNLMVAHLQYQIANL